jgi:hypothetical protein
MDGLLDRILESFGLIACGWSGDYDTALRTALERAGVSPFGSCWTVRSALTDVTAQLVAHRRAQVIPIKDADTFFTELREKVLALERRSQEAPVSVQVATTMLKKYLPDERRYIELHDMLQGETNQLLGALALDAEPVTAAQPTPASVATLMQQYESAISPLCALLGTGGYYGQARHAAEWIGVIKRVARRPLVFTQYPDWDQVRRYPAVLLCYAVGTGAIAASHEDTFISVMANGVFELDGNDLPAFYRANAWAIIGYALGGLPGLDEKREPARLTLHLHRVLRALLRELLPDDTTYDGAFDRFELLTALLMWDWRSRQGKERRVALGRFAWTHDTTDQRGLTHRMERELDEQRQNWPLVKHGFFGGDFTKAKAALGEIREQVERSQYG